MKVEMNEQTNTLTVTIPLGEPKPSRSGNSSVIASTHGNQFIGSFKGKATYVQMNVMQMGSGDGEIGTPEIHIVRRDEVERVSQSGLGRRGKRVAA